MPQLDDWVTPSGSPWMFLILYTFATIDGFFPPVPSKSVVIVLTAVLSPGRGPTSWLLGAVAAAGAFTGDQIAYSIGRRVSVRSMRSMRSRRVQKALLWAENALEHRGAVGAGQLLDHPLLAVVVGVAGGLFTGAAVDYVLRRRSPAADTSRVAVTCPASEERRHRTRR